MIVYNVARRWFAEKVPADKYRMSLSLKPAALLKVTVDGRDDLSALLNALCEPALPNQPVPAPATVELVERAYVETGKDIPDYVPRFLLDDEGKKLWDERHRK